jgi:serine O-acetyltransferase
MNDPTAQPPGQGDGPSDRDEPRIKSFREMIALVLEDRTVNDGSWLRPGCQAMAVYRFGAWRLGIRRRLLRAPLTVIYKALHVWVRNFYGIEIHASARFGRRLRIAHQSGIVVHELAVIGDDCLIRQGVSIGRASNHGGGVRSRAPVLGNRVEVGAGAVLIGGITIGDDVVIGPNAVVMSNVPAGSIVASPPARIMARPPRQKNPAQAG